jgi:hypothetical protein
MDYVKGEFGTPFGAMHYAITQGDHVSITAGGSSDELGPITVNGVPYYTHIHLHLQPDGSTWEIKNSSEVHMSRHGTGGDSTQAARRKAYEGVRAAWAEYIMEQPALLVEAERAHLNNKIGDAEEEIEKSRAALEAAEANREELIAREREALAWPERR